MALRALADDPVELVTTTRRLIEKHAECAPLHWFCAHLLHSPEPRSAARELLRQLDDDRTPDALIELLPDDAVVLVLGWPPLVGEALLRRGDVRVLAVDEWDSPFSRHLERSGVDVEVVEPRGLGVAVSAASVVLVEVAAASSSTVLAPLGASAAVAVARHVHVPAWAVVGVGAALPEQVVAHMLDSIGGGRRPWQLDVEPVALAQFDAVVTSAGRLAPGQPLAPSCPYAPELLPRSVR